MADYWKLWQVPEPPRPRNLEMELDELKKAHLELTAMVHARLDRLEAQDRVNRFGYNGGL